MLGGDKRSPDRILGYCVNSNALFDGEAGKGPGKADDSCFGRGAAAEHGEGNRRHEIVQRCSRWLLMTHDRVNGDEFALTHEFLSKMLGVRRAGVSVAAGILQRARVIKYSRGRVTIIDREGLEGISCECYRIVREEFDRLLG